MVVRLKGKLNGSIIIFERSDGDRWEAVVPAVSSGIYIVELQAEDDAGNVAYCAKYIVTIDIEALTVSLVPMDYCAELIHMEFVLKMEKEDLRTEIVDDDFIIEIIYPKHGEGGAA